MLLNKTLNPKVLTKGKGKKSSKNKKESDDNSYDAKEDEISEESESNFDENLVQESDQNKSDYNYSPESFDNPKNKNRKKKIEQKLRKKIKIEDNSGNEQQIKTQQNNVKKPDDFMAKFHKSKKYNFSTLLNEYNSIIIDEENEEKQFQSQIEQQQQQNIQESQETFISKNDISGSANFNNISNSMRSRFQYQGYDLSSSEDEEEMDVKYESFLNSIGGSSKLKDEKKQESFQVKVNQSGSMFQSEITLENRLPYARRDNFIQTFRGWFLYLLKLMKFKLIPIKYFQKACSNEEEEGRDRFQLGFFAKNIFNSFESIGISEENIFQWVLEKSYNNKNVKEFTSQIMKDYFQDEIFKKAFEREFMYKKGKINYFDPDIEGDILVSSKNNSLTFLLKLTGFKDRIYARVMVTMYKKLIRLIILFKLMMKVLHRNSGKNLMIQVDFYFKFNISSFKETEAKPTPQTFHFRDNIILKTYYVQTYNRNSTNQSLKQSFRSDKKSQKSITNDYDDD